ncbi:serine hydrolase-like protein isoform X2 [Anoplophora glabripennis]|nr:serine hydrolase-like protein isoform X2 [Anoplophora glabripennis]
MPVLVIHGIMDNAGSFDHLIPLLPRQFYYICIDLPGHGLSSHFPAHHPIYTLTYIIVYKLIADYFDRRRYIIMGHSYGGQLGTLFTQLYPQYVEKLILLDTITLLPVFTTHFKNYLVEKFDNYLLMEEKLSKNSNPPSYTYDEAVDKIFLGRYSPITAEAAVALSHRALKPTNNGRYMFNLDQRIKHFINPLRDFRYTIETLREDRINCPVLIILGKQSKMQLKYMKTVLNYFKKMKNVTVKMVEGYHDVHNDSPEVVAPHICRFLLKKSAKL